MKHIKRLMIEYNDLLIRILRLEKYLDNNLEYIEEDTANLLIEQFKVMNTYLIILVERISKLNIEIIPNIKEHYICYKYKDMLYYLETDRLYGESRKNEW